MVKLVLTLFVLVFAAHGTDNMILQEQYSYHEHTLSDCELINQKISNMESAVQVLFKQSESKKYQYLEVGIHGNEDYHNQMNGLYEKKGYYNNHVSYTKIFPVGDENTFIGWDSNLQEGAGAWKFVHNQKRIAHLEDPNLINPFISTAQDTKKIVLENFSFDIVHLIPLDKSPLSARGNYYEDHLTYKYVIFQVNDQNYGKGLAKYSNFNGRWETFRLEKYGMIQNIANDYSERVRSLLDYISEGNRNSAIFYGHLPPSIFSGSPMNFHVRFYPLIPSNIATPPTEELHGCVIQLTKAYHEYAAQKGESSVSGFWTSPLKSNDPVTLYDDDPQNFDDTDARDTMSTIYRASGSTPNHNIEINMELQKENEDLQKKFEELQKEYKTLESEYKAQKWLHEEEHNKMQKEAKKQIENKDSRIQQLNGEKASQNGKIQQLNGEKLSLQKQLSEERESLTLERKSFYTQLSEEKESSQKQLSAEKESSQKQLSAEKESLQNRFNDQEKKRLKEMKALTKTNKEVSLQRDEFRAQSEVLSNDKTSLDNKVLTLEEKIETFKAKKEGWKTSYKNKINEENKKFEQVLENVRYDYEQKIKEFNRSKEKFAAIDIHVQTERNENEVLVQTDGLGENPNDPENDEFILQSANPQTDDEFYDLDPEIMSLQFFIDQQKDI